MTTITHFAYPRAALIGNPSDGYNGKTIAFVFSDKKAQVTLTPSDEVRFIPTDRDQKHYSSLHDLDADIQIYGYYGGIRLLKAAVRKFIRYTEVHQLHLETKNFTLSYSSDIPGRLGLAGSSAIITACMRCLMEYYDIDIPTPMLANLVLSVETEELDIAAGLQDRVAQAYERPVFMDFDRKYFDEQGFGNYQSFSADMLPNLYIAYRTELAEGSEVVHNDLRKRYNANDPLVHNAMNEWAALSDAFYSALVDGRTEDLPALIDRNFDIRASVCAISRDNLLMINTARACGASAKFTGSGGAIIGTYNDNTSFRILQEEMQKIGAEVMKPTIVDHQA